MNATMDPSDGEAASRLRRLARDPLTTFLLAGAAIFALYAAVESAGEQPVEYTAEIETSLVDEFEMLSGREAEEADVARMRQDFLTDELLFREAVERGIHLTDSQVRERMVEKVRYLIAGAPPEPTEAEVLDYYAEHLDRYESEPEITFEQVFFEGRPDDPQTTLAALRRGEGVADDELWTGRTYPDYGHSMIRGIFGQEFLDELGTLRDGEWVGPIKSSRGWHFVRKSGSAPGRLLPFTRVREQARQDMIIAKMQQSIDRAYEELAKKYKVNVDA